MRSTYPPCLPTTGKVVPATPAWLHEVKYDGYRLIVAHEGNRVRLFTRNGHDWSSRYPWIVDSALRNRHRQFVIDGEAVILGVDGSPDFNALHSRQREEDVQLYAFDILALDGEDLCGLPLSMRKTNLACTNGFGPTPAKETTGRALAEMLARVSFVRELTGMRAGGLLLGRLIFWA